MRKIKLCEKQLPLSDCMSTYKITILTDEKTQQVYYGYNVKSIGNWLFWDCQDGLNKDKKMYASENKVLKIEKINRECIT